MTIEIQRPEIEALIQQRQQAGKFANVEDTLMNALLTAPAPSPLSPQLRPARSMREAFEMIRGQADDVDFERVKSPGRPVDL